MFDGKGCLLVMPFGLNLGEGDGGILAYIKKKRIDSGLPESNFRGFEIYGK